MTEALVLRDESEVLPDLLAHGLKIVFVGTTVGARSAMRGHYHSGLRNCFWNLFFSAGFTPELWQPEDDARLTSIGIGITDLRKNLVCNDDRLLAPLTDSERKAFRAKILRFAPRIVCFNGKSPYRMWSGLSRVDYGPQEETIGTSRVFVAPSTNGASTGITELRNRYYRMLRELSEGLE